MQPSNTHSKKPLGLVMTITDDESNRPKVEVYVRDLVAKNSPNRDAALRHYPVRMAVWVPIAIVLGGVLLGDWSQMAGRYIESEGYRSLLASSWLVIRSALHATLIGVCALIVVRGSVLGHEKPTATVHANSLDA